MRHEYCTVGNTQHTLRPFHYESYLSMSRGKALMTTTNLSLKELERRDLGNDFDRAGLLVGFGSFVPTNRYSQGVRCKGCGGRMRVNKRKKRARSQDWSGNVGILIAAPPGRCAAATRSSHTRVACVPEIHACVLLILLVSCTYGLTRRIL